MRNSIAAPSLRVLERRSSGFEPFSSVGRAAARTLHVAALEGHSTTTARRHRSDGSFFPSNRNGGCGHNRAVRVREFERAVRRCCRRRQPEVVGGVISDTPTVAKIKTTETITGGAGRFAGARGTSTTTGETSVMPNGDQVFTFQFSGSLVTNP